YTTLFRSDYDRRRIRAKGATSRHIFDAAPPHCDGDAARKHARLSSWIGLGVDRRWTKPRRLDAAIRFCRTAPIGQPPPSRGRDVRLTRIVLISLSARRIALQSPVSRPRAPEASKAR